MSDFRFKPLEGLLNLNNSEFKSVSVLSALQYVEDKLQSSPKGRAKKLMLFFIIINELVKRNLPFYVKGGIIEQYYLGEHARATNDIDVIIKDDPEGFYNKVKEALESYHSDIYFTNFVYEEEASKNCFFYNTFSIMFDVCSGGEVIDKLLLEGVYGDTYDEITPIKYQGPSFISDNFTFLGVPIEYIFAEKILAITSELARPYKHLIDAYTISRTEVDIPLLKKYLSIILEEENIERRKFCMLIGTYEYRIKPIKKWKGSYILPLLQAGYRIDEEEMIESLNTYMQEHSL